MRKVQVNSLYYSHLPYPTSSHWKKGAGVDSNGRLHGVGRLVVDRWVFDRHRHHTFAPVLVLDGQ